MKDRRNHAGGKHGRSRRADIVASFPTTDEIGERAHQLFVNGGRDLKLIPEYWRLAEDELLNRAARRVIKPGFDPSLA